jgi:hypothetical protein
LTLSSTNADDAPFTANPRLAHPLYPWTLLVLKVSSVRLQQRLLPIHRPGNPGRQQQSQALSPPKECPPTKGTPSAFRSLGKISRYVKSPAKAVGILKRKSVERVRLSRDPTRSTPKSVSGDQVIGCHPNIPEEDEREVYQEGAAFEVGKSQVPTGKYDDVIARLFDTFREYDEGLENPAGASVGSSKPQSSKEKGKGKR